LEVKFVFFNKHRCILYIVVHTLKQYNYMRHLLYINTEVCAGRGPHIKEV